MNIKLLLLLAVAVFACTLTAQAQARIWLENFEGAGGPPPVTNGDPYWLNQALCNGIWTDNTGNPAANLTTPCVDGGWPTVQGYSGLVGRRAG